jgi:uncharacterized Tic20 family protein
MTDAPPPPGQPNEQPGQPQQPYQQPGAYQQPQQPLSPQDEKLWSTLTHVGGILFSFVVPLITYLVFKDRGPFVREHTKQALNFTLTMLIAYVAGTILTVIVIGGLVVFAAWVLSIIFGIMAAIAANKGEMYKYPLAIPFIK